MQVQFDNASAELIRSDAEMQRLQAELERVARRNGRLELANEVAQWAQRNAARIPPDVRADLADWLIREMA